MAKKSVPPAAHEMRTASTEFHRTLTDIAKRLSVEPRAESLAKHLSLCAALFARIGDELEGAKQLDSVEIQSLARAFELVSEKLLELVTPVQDLEEFSTREPRPVAYAAAMQYASIRVTELSELTNQITQILNLRVR